jgi:hypothetical protein
VGARCVVCMSVVARFASVKVKARTALSTRRVKQTSLQPRGCVVMGAWRRHLIQLRVHPPHPQITTLTDD